MDSTAAVSLSAYPPTSPDPALLGALAAERAPRDVPAALVSIDIGTTLLRPEVAPW